MNNDIVMKVVPFGTLNNRYYSSEYIPIEGEIVHILNDPICEKDEDIMPFKVGDGNTYVSNLPYLYRAHKYISIMEDGTMKEMKRLEMPLLTENYTEVRVESEYQYNAPHYFEVHRKEDGELVGKVHFQEGPIKETGVNGVNNEDLINMVICRLESFQNSEYKCRENALAITKLEEALMWLRYRTNARTKRGVEGTSTV